MRTALYWAPRILAIAFGLFVSLFALDSFNGQASIWVKLTHFVIHLIPVAVYAVILVLAWPWEWVAPCCSPHSAQCTSPPWDAIARTGT
jgi:hypothetical protein